MNNTEILNELLEAQSENKTLRAEVKELKRTLSQYEQDVPAINLVDGVRNPLIDEAS